MKRFLFFTLFFSFVATSVLQAQYFGRNKPRYQKQNFKVTQTNHFEIYEYLDNPEKLKELAAAAEVWYQMHQAVLRDTFTKLNPLIIYNDHAGFQQTNTVFGDISVGTGGVTEGLRNRVVFPVAMTNQQTHHVLGHEMVHAFQYHMILEGDSTNMQNLANLPLWMIEGLAEYLSIGRVDAHTALWMRDAVLHDDLPTVSDLNNYRYFPYRWGQAFWAYVAGIYGDAAIRDYFMNTAKYGLEPATQMTLGTTTEDLSRAWHAALRNHYGRYVGLDEKAIATLEAAEIDRKSKEKKEDRDKLLAKLAKADKAPGKLLFDEQEGGRMAICPVLSPNGKYVIFLSEKSLFSTDLFLAEANSGKIIKKVVSTVTDGHIDQLNFIESAGTWSPDNKRFAFDVYEKGVSTLIIEDVIKGKKKKEKITLPGVPAFSNPAWSPDGKTIVVSGLVNGQTDLYEYNLKTKKVRQLTNDRASEILPSFSRDGKLLAYSTDKISLERGRSNGAWTMNLAVMNMETGEVENLDIFPGADNLNPTFDKAGNLVFLSNRDGFRNLYWYKFDEKKVYQLTKVATGITGITPYSPALTVSEDRDRILYTYYSNGSYKIYQTKSSDFVQEEVDPMKVDMVPATLPPFAPGKRDVVNTNLRLLDANTDTIEAVTSLTAVKYKPKFSLDYIGGSAGVGVATGNSSFGLATGLAGGIDMLFNDMLGNNQLYAGVALNGEIVDAAGQFSYINQKNRINWGFNLSHIPYRSGQYYQDPDLDPEIETTLGGQQYFGYQDNIIIQRIFQERVGTFAFFPLSVTKRFEVGAAYTFYHQRVDRYVNYVDASGFVLGQDRERLQAPGSDNLWNLSAAYVGDNSYFGFTAPLQGWRYRIGYERFFGSYNFNTFLADGRRYFYKKPVTFAFRGLAYTRFGGNANNVNEVYPLYAGESYFVHGYTSEVLYYDAPELLEQMAGSKLLVANFEVRLPFTGPRQLSVIQSNFLVSDLNVFFDAGLGFFETEDLKENPNNGSIQHKPILSTGVSLRVNIFGVFVLEPYFALPLSVPSENRRWVFGLNWIPGW